MSNKLTHFEVGTGISAPARGALNWRAYALLAMVGALLPAGAQTIVTTNLWEIPAGSRDYMTTGTTERGIAINPVTGNVLIVSRAGGVNVVVVDPVSGEDVGRLDVTDVFGGTFALSAIGVAEDGAIYAANLVTAASDASPFKIYRWANESAFPTVAYQGAPSAGMRFGDSLDVRGAGAATQIAAGSGGTATAVRFAVFSTADGQVFEAKAFSPSGIGGNLMQKGIAFGPTNTVYGVANGNNVRHVRFDLAAGTAAVVREWNLGGAISPLVVDVVRGVLAVVNVVAPNAHQLVLYDISDPAAPVLSQSIPFPAPVTANANGVGAVDMANGRIAALDTQNGVLMVSYGIDPTPVAPVITAQPANSTVLEGGSVAFNVGARGTKPLSYFWYQNGTNLVRAGTSSSHNLTATLASAGTYSAVVSNAVGTVQSAEATLTVTPVVRSGRLVRAWEIRPGQRPYIGTDNNQRGMAFNPVTKNVLVVSRTLGQTNVYVLDGLTGADRHRLRPTAEDGSLALSGGTFVLNMIGVAEDGAVYVCNLGNTTTGADLRIYRWANDAPNTVPTLAYGPENPSVGGRIGDTMDVRGSGLNTQLLLGSRSGKTVAIFTTSDGETFVPTVILTADAADGNFGLGVAFGEGNTFWGKALGANFPLRLVSFNLDTGEGTTVGVFPDPAFPSGATAIGYDPATKFLAAVALETPDNLRLYDAAKPAEAPVLLHQEFFGTDNANGNGTGAVDFGAGHVFALNSNNGLAAFRLRDPATEPIVLRLERIAAGVALRWDVGVLESARSVTGPWSEVTGARSPHTNNLQGPSPAFWRVRN